MNIVIPLAGRGRRFENTNVLPKPLISFNDKTMIEWAVDTLGIDGQYIFIILKEHIEMYNIDKLLKSKYPSAKIVITDEITEGPACTAMLAKEYINDDEPLIITNCDQIMTWNSVNFLDFIFQKDIHGCVVTYYSDTTKNSYAKINENGNIIEVAEKKVISKYSLNGIHFWSKGKYFVSSTEEMIKADIRVNNEFYIAPTYNFLIKDKKIIKIYNIDVNDHHAIGTPEDLKTFLEKDLIK